MPQQFASSLAALGLFWLCLLSGIVATWCWVIARLLMRQPILPSQRPLIVPWNAKTVLGVLLVFLFLRPLLSNFYFYGLRGHPVGEKVTIQPIDQLLVSSLVNLMFLPLAWGVLRAYSGARARDFGLEKGKIGMNALRGIIAWPVVTPFIYGFYYFILFGLKMLKDRQAHPVEQMAGQNPSVLVWVMLFFTAVVVAPLTEEFLFRGVLLGWLGKVLSGAKTNPGKAQLTLTIWDNETIDASPTEETLGDFDVPDSPGRPMGWIVANLAISLVFAALHVEAWPTPIPLFLLAIVLGILYQRTAGIIAPLALHMTFNAVSTVVLLLTTMAGGVDEIKRGVRVDPGAQPPAIQKPADVAK